MSRDIETDCQQLLIDERQELVVRIRKLETFRGLDAYRALPQPEQDRISLQLIFMRGYAAALSQRIEAAG